VLAALFSPTDRAAAANCAGAKGAKSANKAAVAASAARPGRPALFFHQLSVIKQTGAHNPLKTSRENLRPV